MRIDTARLAAIFAVCFMLIGLGAAVDAALSGISGQVIWVLLLQPRSLLTTSLLILVVAGLWWHFRWAWWLALSVGVFHLYRVAEFWASFPAIAADNIPSQLLTVGFVVVLLLPTTRNLCGRSFRT